MNCFNPSRHSRRGRSAHAVAARTGEHAGERADADAGLPCAGTVAGRVSHRELQQLLPALGGDLSTAPAPLRSMGFWGGAGSCAGLRIRSSILALSARLTSSTRWACSTVGTTACCFCHAVARQVAGYMDVCSRCPTSCQTITLSFSSSSRRLLASSYRLCVQEGTMNVSNLHSSPFCGPY
jgi:hypothetical protein